MPSKIQVDQIAGATGSTVTLPSGQTLDLSSGTVNLPSSALSALNASNLTSGTVPSARLSLTSSDLPTVPTTKGGTGLTTIGTANQVLRVNSGATGLEFASASSDYVLLATTTASSSSTISFDGYFSSTYDTYIVRFYDIYHSADAQLYLRYRRSNADVTASNYKTLIIRGYTDLTPSDAVNASRSSWNASGIALTSGDNPSTQASNARLQGELILFNPLSTATHKAIQSSISYRRTTDSDTMHFQKAYGRLEDNTNALSGLTFYPASGNFTAGTFKLYGIK
jgi:hypothetical protein